jgi:ABC-type lipoprotein export system ATPase subunit
MPALVAQSIGFAYGRSTATLVDVDLRVETGSMVAITGPSGRGKSTLLYLLGLMLTPTRGDILVDGTSTARLRDFERSALRATHYGFVFQDAALDASRSVIDNVMEPLLYAPSDDENGALARAHELLAQLGVATRADARPGQVSGGQAGRIALCRALVSRPRIIIADEPTGNLDRDAAEVVVKALRDHAASGGTVVIATHDETVSALCDETVRL